MPAYARPENGELCITFRRDGEDDEQEVVPDGQRAVSAAMKMLALRDELQPGDKLTVERHKRPGLVERNLG